MLVIFDCDGVLVDSEHLAATVFSQVLASYGHSMTPQECFARFKGHTLGACVEILESRFGFVTPADFLEQINLATERAFNSELSKVEGVELVIKYVLDQGHQICVASNGGFKKLCNSLRTVNLWEYFDGRCYSAEFVERGKPAPDLFLHAANTLNVRPKDCLVIEDSHHGVAAAKAANMKVAHFLLGPEETDADYTFTAMDELLNSKVFDV